jgi:hypothetical protein
MESHHVPSTFFRTGFARTHHTPRDTVRLTSVHIVEEDLKVAGKERENSKV